MFNGALLPAVFAGWNRWRGVRPAGGRASRLTAADSCAVWPDGLFPVAPETHAVVAAANDFARLRCIELQMVVEPRLVAQADAAAYRTCLRDLLFGAIGRAGSGVLVTAMRDANGVEIAVLDDGAAPAGAPPGAKIAVPPGATLTAEYRPKCGTTILLRLPRPEQLPVPPDGGAFSGYPAPAQS
ncbi:MAG TPA: hypothetical protein VND19_02625 [Acetobacteraceae bacterium]|nr:hypothetical protein [Acetobacteraceae bacterium]